MASSSSSSVQQKFQVFLSFRGEDTRKNFTSHLHAALKRKGIDTYIDDRLKKGETINALFTRIEESTISIIVLSKNYASSTWCLDELSKILECNKTMGQEFVPIFYHVDPSDVRYQKGSFEEAFKKQQERFKDRTDKVERWRAALVEVGNIKGVHLHEQSDRLESEVVEEIAQAISNKLMCKSFVPIKPLVGIDSRVEEIESLLCFDSDLKDVRIVGIWGMGGIGKSTIAEAVHNRFIAKFDGNCFVNVREDKYQEKLFSEILGDKNLNVDTYSLDASIADRLQRKKVFFVLDDVNDLKQLDLLSLKFGCGSRIVVTSRDKQLLKPAVDVCYEVRGLTDDEALQLFSLCAFKQNYPRDDFVGLSKEVVRYVGGVPLALRVFGSSLYCKELELCKNDLKKLKETPNPKIDKILRISYDGLDDELKNIFLDIACFFNYWESRDYVEDLLDGMLYASLESGMGDLIDRSLLTISFDNKIKMHDLLRQMALNIIRQDPNEPGKRRRLCTHENICDVLENNTGTGSVKGILLDLSKIIRSVFICPTAFKKMRGLKILKFYYSGLRRGRQVFLKKGLKSFPGFLSYLHWEEYPSKSLPSDFCPESLVELRMPNSDVERLWDGSKDLVKLKRLDLSHSQYLIKIPDLSKATNLVTINLNGCKKVEDFQCSVGCRSLETLCLRGCSNITKFPEISKNLVVLDLSETAIEEVPSSIGHSRSLKTLRLNRCSNITKLPEIPENLTSLDLYGTAIEEVPSSIGRVSQLKDLDLRNCKSLKRLPSSICKLKFLEWLNLDCCRKLESFPEILETMGSLKFLDLSFTSIEELHSSIANLVRLSELNLFYCRKLKKLPSSIRDMNWECISGFPKLEVIEKLLGTVEELCIRPYNQIKIKRPWDRPVYLLLDYFPSSLMCMPSLKKLDLRRNDFETIPVCIEQLLQLNSLDLSYCKSLQSLPPELPPSLSYLNACGCKSLEKVSQAFPILRCKDQRSLFTNCLKLDQKCINWVKSSRSIRQKATEDVNIYRQIKMKGGMSSLSICFPGSEIPEWFSCKSQGSSVTIQLPPHLHTDNKFVGFTVCTVLTLTDNSYPMSVKYFAGFCRCDFKTNGDDIVGSSGFTWFVDADSIDSDHVLISYHLDFYRIWCEKKSKHRLTEASFEFSFSRGCVELLKYCVFKECGVCLLYAPDHFPHGPSEESNSLMIQPSSPHDPNRGVINQDFVEPMVEDGAIITHESGSFELNAQASSSYDPALFKVLSHQQDPLVEEEEPERKRLKYS